MYKCEGAAAVQPDIIQPLKPSVLRTLIIRHDAIMQFQDLTLRVDSTEIVVTGRYLYVHSTVYVLGGGGESGWRGGGLSRKR